MARPTFKPTPAQRRMVASCAAGGMSHEDLALALEISRNTLEKHFVRELATGAAKKRMEVMDALCRAAKKGNVSAAKQFLSMTPRFGVPPLAPEKPQPVGKKEQAQADAATAQVGTDWEHLLNNATPQ